MMEHTVLHTVTNPDGTRRVEIFRRANGTFGFEEWKWDAEESFWYVFGKYSVAVVDTFDRAVLEAHGRVDWLTNEHD